MFNNNDDEGNKFPCKQLFELIINNNKLNTYVMISGVNFIFFRFDNNNEFVMNDILTSINLHYFEVILVPCWRLLKYFLIDKKIPT